MNRNQAKKKLKQYLFYTLFVFIGLPLLTWFIIKVLGDGDGIEVLLQGLWGAFGLFWIVDTFRSFTAISIYLTSNEKSEPEPEPGISTKKESSANFFSHFLNYINQRKKNISLFILLIIPVKILINFLFFPYPDYENYLTLADGRRGSAVYEPAPFSEYIEYVFYPEDLWIFGLAIFIMLFISWYFNDKIQKR